MTSIEVGPDTSGEAAAARMQSALEELWLAGRETSLERIATVERAVASLLLGEEHDLADAVIAAHKLAGTLGMFGLPEGSVAARSIETALEDGNLDGAEVTRLAGLVVQMRRAVEQSPGAGPAPAPVAAGTGRFRLVGADCAYLEALRVGATAAGFAVVHERPPAAAGPDAADAAILVVDAGSLDPGELRAAVRTAGHDTVVAAVRTPADLAVRCALVDDGASFVLDDTLPAERALELVVGATRRVRDGVTLRVVTSRPVLAERLATALGSWDVASLRPDELATDTAWTAAEVVAVDLAGLGREALALVRLVRATPGAAASRVVALVARKPANADEMAEALFAGADDVVWLSAGWPALADWLRHSVRWTGPVLGAGSDVATPAPAVAASGGPGAAREAEGRSVLVVEDDPLVATVVSDLLTGRGHEVTVIDNGTAAADLLCDPAAAHRFGLVVLDVSLPGLDGFAVLRRLRAAGREGRIPVVLLTARAAEDEVVAGLELGAVDYVAKPFSPLVLVSRLERVLGP